MVLAWEGRFFFFFFSFSFRRFCFLTRNVKPRREGGLFSNYALVTHIFSRSFSPPLLSLSGSHSLLDTYAQAAKSYPITDWMLGSGGACRPSSLYRFVLLFL